MTSEVADDGRGAKDEGHENGVLSSDDRARSEKSKFRFKSSKLKAHPHDDEIDLALRHSSYRSSHHSHRRRHHRSKRQRSPSSHAPSPTSPPVDPDTAFRESLFDALADDEGAAFWEGVYGQPVPAVPLVAPGPTGVLERMSDDEYAAHVRAEMYKKTHQYLVEERERRVAARKEQEARREEARRERAEADRFAGEVEESLRKGRERRDKGRRVEFMKRRWAEYESACEDLGSVTTATAATTKIPWPVMSGKRTDVNKEEIETFFLNALAAQVAKTEEVSNTADLVKRLKTERIRWHPDKVQQKLGRQEVDEGTMKGVTAVFQIIDRLWNERRDGDP